MNTNESDKNNVIKEFKVNKLFGFKDIVIHFRNTGPVILLAENGSGKTTVMKLFAYLLTGKYFLLSEIEFSDIEVTMNNDGKKFKIFKSDIERTIDFYKKELKDEFNIITKLDINPDDFIYFVTFVYDPNKFDKFTNHPIAKKMYETTPFTWDNIKKLFNKSHSFFIKKNSKKLKLKYDRDLFEFYLKDYDVIYLPTFRRIESKFSISEINPFTNNETLISNFESNQMYFNLDDIEKRLNESLSRIVDISKDAISNALVHSLTNKENVSSDLVDFNESKEKISSFEKTLKRITLNEISYKHNKAPEDINKAKISTDTLYGKDVFFNSLLNNTLESLNESDDIERNIINYIESVNKFLLLSGDKKKFIFDRENLHIKLFLVNEDDEIIKEISMNNLSSGEKQIVSMFAPLYLSKNKKIFLIDEPEISLSIKWQELLLPSIYESQLCSQLFAITHSPFTFSNSLESYAIGMEAKNNASDIKEK